MRLIKLLFIQGFIECYKFNELSETVLNFGKKNGRTDIWYVRQMSKRFFKTAFLTIINLIFIILLPILVVKFFWL